MLKAPTTPLFFSFFTLAFLCSGEYTGAQLAVRDRWVSSCMEMEMGGERHPLLLQPQTLGGRPGSIFYPKACSEDEECMREGGVCVCVLARMHRPVHKSLKIFVMFWFAVRISTENFTVAAQNLCRCTVM